MPVPTGDPAWFDFRVIIGDTLQPATVVLQDADGVAYDLTGVTGECEIRTAPGGTLLLSPTVSLVVAADGSFTFASSAAATSALTPARARYAVRLTWPTGEVRTVLEGNVDILPSVVE